MRLSKAEVAQSILVEMQEDQRWLEEMEKQVEERRQHIDADRAWLTAHGFSQTQQSVVPTESTKPVNEAQPGNDGTIWTVAAEVLRIDGKKTLSQLHAALAARGKDVHKSSLDAAIRRHLKVFEMQKHFDGKKWKNLISLKDQQVTA